MWAKVNRGSSSVAKALQYPGGNHNPTPNPMVTPSTSTPFGESVRVSILSQMPRDGQKALTDNLNNPHQSRTDGKTTHQNMIDGISDHQAGTDGKCHHQSSADENRYFGDGNQQSRSTITSTLGKLVLTYVKWHQGCYPGIDRSVMDSLGCWLCIRGISVYKEDV
jgi:hypothetical protein